MESIVKIGKYFFNAKNRIGGGTFSSIYKGFSEANPGQAFAIKKITLNPNFPVDRQIVLIERELKINSSIVNINIVRFFEFIPDPMKKDTYYLIFEFCEGGDLENLIQKYGGLPEITAAYLFISFTGIWQQKIFFCPWTKREILQFLKFLILGFLAKLLTSMKWALIRLQVLLFTMLQKFSRKTRSTTKLIYGHWASFITRCFITHTLFWPLATLN